METDQSQVAVELHMRMEDQGAVEKSTTKATGSLYKKGSMDVVTYTEILDENDAHTVKNLLTIQPQKVSIKRSGAVQMHQQFICGQTTECLFQHVYGAIHMETYTKDIHYQPADTEKEARLTIHYLVKLNGQEPRKHQLILIIREHS